MKILQSVSNSNMTSSEALKDYTNTIAAIYLLEEVMDKGAVITVNSVEAIIAKENEKKNPTLGSVIKQILAKANMTDAGYKWKKNEQNNQDHLEVAIAVGSAVYTVDFIRNPEPETYKYTIHIKAKLKKGEIAGRGKLFLNHSHEAEVNVEMHNEIFYAVTKKGLKIHAKSFLPHAPQNEVLAKFAESIVEGKNKRLAVMGTGSGKSIIMAGIAQAVGRTVMIIPDKSLVDQQVKETIGFFKDGGKKAPSIFTFDKLKRDLDIADIDKLNEDEISNIKDYFSKVIGGDTFLVDTQKVSYDQIVLEAEHPFFKLLAPEIKNSMVLMDESHQHTFTQKDTNTLKTIIENNSILALTATPTSKLYELFPGEPLDDFSLGSAIELGLIRPIKPEVTYLEGADLVEQAVINYFNDYYLTKGNNDFVAPGVLLEQLRKEGSNASDDELKKHAISEAVNLNRLRCRRNMSFSDDLNTRTKLTSIYQKIAKGDEQTTAKYQDKILKLRQDAEINARLEMDIELTPLKVNETRESRRNGIDVNIKAINLKKDIQDEQEKDIQRAINSYAMNLILGDKQAKIAEKDRTHKLKSYLNEYDEDIQKFKNGLLEEKSRKEKFNECEKIITKQDVKKKLLDDKSSALQNLPRAQKEILEDLICVRALQLAQQIKERASISEIILNPEPLDLDALKTQKNYVGAVDANTKKDNQKLIDEYLAEIEIGTRTHIVSDKVIATGVSIKDILNVQIINNYSEKIEEDPNSINGPLSCPQAAGRCVRHADLIGRVQQFIDQRYKDKKLITTVDDIINATQSAAKIKEVILNRDKIQAGQKNVAPYTVTNKYKHGQKYRIHLFEADASQFNLDNNFKSFKGDALKSKILKHFKVDIEHTCSIKDLKQLQNRIMKSDEYKVLAKGQGFFTRISQKINKSIIKTLSIKALESMFAEQKENLSKTLLTS